MHLQAGVAGGLHEAGALANITEDLMSIDSSATDAALHDLQSMLSGTGATVESIFSGLAAALGNATSAAAQDVRKGALQVEGVLLDTITQTLSALGGVRQDLSIGLAAAAGNASLAAGYGTAAATAAGADIRNSVTAETLTAANRVGSSLQGAAGDLRSGVSAAVGNATLAEANGAVAAESGIQAADAGLRNATLVTASGVGTAAHDLSSDISSGVSAAAGNASHAVDGAAAAAVSGLQAAGVDLRSATLSAIDGVGSASLALNSSMAALGQRLMQTLQGAIPDAMSGLQTAINRTREVAAVAGDLQDLLGAQVLGNLPPAVQSVLISAESPSGLDLNSLDDRLLRLLSQQQQEYLQAAQAATPTPTQTRAQAPAQAPAQTPAQMPPQTIQPIPSGPLPGSRLPQLPDPAADGISAVASGAQTAVADAQGLNDLLNSSELRQERPSLPQGILGRPGSSASPSGLNLTAADSEFLQLLSAEGPVPAQLPGQTGTVADQRSATPDPLGADSALLSLLAADAPAQAQAPTEASRQARRPLEVNFFLKQRTCTECLCLQQCSPVSTRQAQGRESTCDHDRILPAHDMLQGGAIQHTLPQRHYDHLDYGGSSLRSNVLQVADTPAPASDAGLAPALGPAQAAGMLQAHDPALPGLFSFPAIGAAQPPSQRLSGLPRVSVSLPSVALELLSLTGPGQQDPVMPPTHSAPQIAPSPQSEGAQPPTEGFMFGFPLLDLPALPSLTGPGQQDPATAPSQPAAWVAPSPQSNVPPAAAEGLGLPLPEQLLHALSSFRLPDETLPGLPGFGLPGSAQAPPQATARAAQLPQSQNAQAPAEGFRLPDPGQIFQVPHLTMPDLALPVLPEVGIPRPAPADPRKQTSLSPASPDSQVAAQPSAQPDLFILKPNFTLPEVELPGLPALPSLPPPEAAGAVHAPSQDVAFSVPELQAPNVTLPAVALPQVSLRLLPAPERPLQAPVDSKVPAIAPDAPRLAAMASTPVAWTLAPAPVALPLAALDPTPAALAPLSGPPERAPATAWAPAPLSDALPRGARASGPTATAPSQAPDAALAGFPAPAPATEPVSGPTARASGLEFGLPGGFPQLPKLGLPLLALPQLPPALPFGLGPDASSTAPVPSTTDAAPATGFEFPALRLPIFGDAAFAPSAQQPGSEASSLLPEVADGLPALGLPLLALPGWQLTSAQAPAPDLAPATSAASMPPARHHHLASSHILQPERGPAPAKEGVALHARQADAPGVAMHGARTDDKVLARRADAPELATPHSHRANGSHDRLAEVPKSANAGTHRSDAPFSEAPVSAMSPQPGVCPLIST